MNRLAGGDDGAGARGDADPFAALDAKAAAQWNTSSGAVGRTVIAEARAALEAWWNAALTFEEARAWGGYSVSQLRRDVQAGRIPVTPDGRIRRRDVPVRPGHRLPLDAEPAPTLRDGRGGYRRRSLKHRDRELAKKDARQTAAKLEAETTATHDPSLGYVLALYRRHELPRHKPGTLRWLKPALELWENWLGSGFRCSLLGPREWEAYKDQRRRRD